MWPTPRCQMIRGTTEDRNKCNLEEKVGQGINGQLNPAWVELLMGWSRNWTDITIDCSEFFKQFCINAWDVGWEDGTARIAKGVPNRVHRLSAIGNGQVPQAMALAWTILSEGVDE